MSTRGEAAVPLTAAPRETEGSCLDAAEAATIHDALKRHRNNRTETARSLGVSRNTLGRKMKKHGIS